MDIVRITEYVAPKEAFLEDGVYLGTWGGNEIELAHKGKTYQLETSEGVRGIGYKVVVTVKLGIATFTEIKN